MDLISGNADLLSIASNLAQAVTGVVAGVAGVRFLIRQCERKGKLERYLLEVRQSDEKSGAEDKGAKSIMHLVGRCAMTEDQILDAAFRSTKIKHWLTVGDDGYAGKLLLQISDEAFRVARTA